MPCVSRRGETRSHASRGTNKVGKPTASADDVKKGDKPEMIVLKDEERGCLAARMFQQKVATGAWIANTLSDDMDLLGDAELVLRRDSVPPRVRLPIAVRDTRGGKAVLKLPEHAAQVHGAVEEEFKM